jgi:4-hydroxy-2-oxoheptanedioate aldolase
LSYPTPTLIDTILTQWDAGERVLFGMQSLLNSTRTCELAGRIGFDMVWLELEHGTADFEMIETLAMATESGGAVPVARIPDTERHHVLRSLEAGARLVVVPMIQTADMAREIVRHGKFPPLGKRGFNTASRGLRYGLAPIQENFAWANRATHLIAQIETMEAVDNLDAILEVDGLSGILVGPGDLSVSLGCTAEFENPLLHDTVAACMKKAFAAGKHAGILANADALLKTAQDAGADFIFCFNETVVLRTQMKERLDLARNGFA